MKLRKLLTELLKFTLVLLKMLSMGVACRRVTSSGKADCLPTQGHLFGREAVTPFAKAVPLVSVVIGIPGVPRVHRRSPRRVDNQLIYPYLVLVPARIVGPRTPLASEVAMDSPLD